MNDVVHQSPLKAVGLVSGGLDSSLAVKIIQGLGVDVYGIHFVLPWHSVPNPAVIAIAKQLQFPLEIFHFGEEFLSLVKAPKYGYGKAMNPCTDCHAYQLKKARTYMIKIGADFVFTGEVLGQRPMSQHRHQLQSIEYESGLEGQLLRPLSAKLLDPIIVERQGKIDREKLFSFSGRGRSDLLKLGKEFGIIDFIPTGGGCLLADINFSKRLKDLFQHGYKNLNEIILLSAGRHFRLSEHFKVIVGRNEEENTKISENANPDDMLFQLKDFFGPLAVLQGKDPGKEFIDQAASLVKRFSKFRDTDVDVCFWPKNDEKSIQSVRPVRINEQLMAKIKI